jgi:hypothetical protein
VLSPRVLRHWLGFLPLIKNLTFHVADQVARFAKRRAEWWLGVARWWRACAKAVQSGGTVEEILQKDE